MVTVLHLILRRRHGILIRILPVFQPISFIVLSATFGFILFYQIICRNHLTSNHQPSEGPWFMGPSLILPNSHPSHHLKIVDTPLHGTD